MTFFWLWCLLGFQNPEGAYEGGTRAMREMEPPYTTWASSSSYIGSQFFVVKGTRYERRWYDNGGEAD